MRAVLLLIALIGASTGILDVVFIVDGSQAMCGFGSTYSPDGCPAWKACLKFIHDICDTWTIGPQDTKVALVTFGKGSKTEWNLNEHKNKTSLLRAIDRLTFPGGELTENLFVDIVVDEISSTASGDRLLVPNAMVVISDGIFHIRTGQAKLWGVALQAKGKVFVVCVVMHWCREEFAQDVASLPKQENKTYFLPELYVPDPDYPDEYSTIDMVRVPLLVQLNAVKGIV